jgi:hypothetical protein
LWNAGQLAEINDYCRCDVLDTYFVFLRTMVLLGQLQLDDEQRLVHAAHDWLLDRATNCAAYSAYLERWGTWVNPWKDAASVET